MVRNHPFPNSIQQLRSHSINCEVAYYWLSLVTSHITQHYATPRNTIRHVHYAPSTHARVTGTHLIHYWTRRTHIETSCKFTAVFNQFPKSPRTAYHAIWSAGQLRRLITRHTLKYHARFSPLKKIYAHKLLWQHAPQLFWTPGIRHIFGYRVRSSKDNFIWCLRTVSRSYLMVIDRPYHHPSTAEWQAQPSAISGLRVWQRITPYGYLTEDQSHTNNGSINVPRSHPPHGSDRPAQLLAISDLKFAEFAIHHCSPLFTSQHSARDHRSFLLSIW
jgi:hypothetical protein